MSKIAEAIAEYIVDPRHARVFNTVAAFDTVEHANLELHRLTGIRNFFPNPEALEEFRRVLLRPLPKVDYATREWGDFQTPRELATQVCDYLANGGISPRVIVEPTFGAGNFVLAATEAFPSAQLIYGVEIQEKYDWHLKIALLLKALENHRASAEIELHQDDIFKHDFPDEICQAQGILVIGNPPWVTNAELGTLNSRNLPAKRNLKALRGIDAITGKSNFDLGEYVLLRTLDLFSGQRGTLAILCKNSVIKNLIELLPQTKYQVANIRALEIDASREFGAAVSASLLVMNLGTPSTHFTCSVATLDQPSNVTRSFGWISNRFVSCIEDYEANADLDGRSPFVWRQGIKHDCASVMELDRQDGTLVNNTGETVNVESEWLYPLLKSSDLRSFQVSGVRKHVIVTQHAIGEDTLHLRKTAPHLWKYLVQHNDQFERRKSSIYHGKPRFSIFGVGEYSFKPFKVAISGLYKEPNFSLVVPIDHRPVMLDDTCYFVGFNNYLDALFTASILNSPAVKRFLKSVVFTDAKRPYTKDILMRIDLVHAASRFTADVFRALWAEWGYSPNVPVGDLELEEYRNHLQNSEQKNAQFHLGI
jgi:hypothetical protein